MSSPSSRAANKWRIVSVDPEVELLIEGQFRPDDGWEDSQAPVMAGSSTPGSSEPLTQWVAGGPRVVTLRSAFRSLHNLDDVRPKERLLERLRERDPTLGRAPKIQVTWGHREVTGFARVTTRTPGFWVTGLPIAVAFDLEVTQAPEILLDLDQAGTDGETQFVTLSDGETFEELGRRYYRSPLRGELIRRQNPDHADQEAAGDRVKVLERDHPASRVAVVPSSPPYLDRTKSGETWQPVIETLAETRGQAGDPGRPWSYLEEVAAGEV